MQTTNAKIPLAGLASHSQNYNRHSAQQVKRLAKSLEKFGQVRSVVVWRSTILAGHGVVEAARVLKWTEIRADVLPDDYPEHLALAYVAADNELARQGDPDMAQLAAILEQSRTADAELLEAIGYSDAEFNALLKEVSSDNNQLPGDTEPQIDRAEELRQKWQVEPGQLWQLGEHRLICGDCTDAAVVARVMGGEKADMVFTSPPYNRGTSTGGGFNDGGLSQQLTDAYVTYDDNRTVEDYRHWQGSLLRSWWDMLVDSGAIFYNHRPRVQAGIYETPLLWNPDLPIRQIVIWHSGAGINFAPTHYRVAHEWIVIFAKPDFRLKDKGDSGVGDVWRFGSVQVTGHPAPFPVELVETALVTTKAKTVYEPFSGSGTTLIACENLGRRCRAVEIAPGYVAVALERWATHTGKTPARIDG